MCELAFRSELSLLAFQGPRGDGDLNMARANITLLTIADVSVTTKDQFTPDSSVHTPHCVLDLVCVSVLPRDTRHWGGVVELPPQTPEPIT